MPLSYLELEEDDVAAYQQHSVDAPRHAGDHVLQRDGAVVVGEGDRPEQPQLLFPGAHLTLLDREIGNLGR